MRLDMVIVTRKLISSTEMSEFNYRAVLVFLCVKQTMIY
jgi:hypothetical protein